MEQNYPQLQLKNQLCFPLYACSRETIKCYTPYLEALGLTYTQYITMLVLWEQNSLTAKALGRILYLDSGTLTPLLKKLEGKGLITRKRSETDERNLVVSLTRQGMALAEEAVHIPEAVNQLVNLEPQEQQELYRLLYKLLEASAS